MIGATLGHYQIIEKLGEGGMGVVYNARDLRLDRPVALKVLPPDKIADPDRKQRFTPEARTIQLLDVATGKVSTVVTLEEDASGICVSPDDRYVVGSQRDRESRDLKLIEHFR